MVGRGAESWWWWWCWGGGVLVKQRTSGSHLNQSQAHGSGTGCRLSISGEEVGCCVCVHV